jgi:hypothetical protein
VGDVKNGVLAIVVLVCMLAGGGVMAFRLGVSNCRKTVAEEANKVQQMVQESDRNIREKVLSASHADNLRWLLSEFKRAD